MDRDVIRYRCPKCNSKLKAPLEFAGNAVTCPVCHRLITVPDDPRAATTPTEEIPLPDEEMVRYRCPFCDKKLKVRPEIVGQEVACPKCGEISTVTRPARRSMGETVKARCGTCNGKFKFSMRHAGRRVACPKCGTKMRIPDPDNPDDTQQELGEETQTVSAATETKPCPYCKAVIPASYDKCPYCDTWTNRRKDIPRETEDLLLERDYATNRLVGKGKKQCPFCRQYVPRTAKVCPICENPLVRKTS